MTLTTYILGYLGIGLSVLGLSTVAFVLGSNRLVPRPELGNRGLQRYRALAGGPFFGLIEAPMRLVAGWLRDVPIAKWRSVIDKKIIHAGDYMGLCADEVISLSFLTMLGFGLSGLALCNVFELPLSIATGSFVLGAFVPWYRLDGVAARRGLEINRTLPGAVDLASLCMGAGLDFPGSLRQMVETAPRADAPIVEEFSRILQQLELGYTRRRALEGFADRVPTSPVQEFVNTVIQAEEKGNPLSEVLQVQARMQRMRRSVSIEEMSARAALLLLGPTMVIFVCIMVMLVSPIAIRFMGGGFG